jgi:hypothetical protein
MATLIDHEGKLAISFDKFAEKDQPQYRHDLTVSNIRIEDIYQDILGKDVEFTGNHGRIYRTNGGYVFVDTNGWDHITVYEDIPTPRNGREYGWKWQYGKWVRDYYNRCSECYHYHDPSLPYCESCGHCHRLDPKLVYCTECLKCHKKGGLCR